MNEPLPVPTSTVEAAPLLSGERPSVLAPETRTSQDSGRPRDNGVGAWKLAVIAACTLAVGYGGGRYSQGPPVAPPSSSLSYQWKDKDIQEFIQAHGGVPKVKLGEICVQMYELGAREQAWGAYYLKPYLQLQQTDNSVTMFKAAVVEEVQLTEAEKEANQEVGEVLKSNEKKSLPKK